jgi:hypothetical protein
MERLQIPAPLHCGSPLAQHAALERQMLLGDSVFWERKGEPGIRLEHGTLVCGEVFGVIYHITCSGCDAPLTVDERYFGKTGTCRQCGKKMVIQLPQRSLPKPQSPPRQQQLARVVTNADNVQQYRERAGNFQAGTSAASQAQSIVRPASKTQRQFARDLGIKVAEHITDRELGELIDSALPAILDSSPAEMVNQLEKRGFKTLIITWPKPDLEAEPTRASLEVIPSESMSLGDIHFALAAVASKIFAEEESNFSEYSRRCEERRAEVSRTSD